MDAEAFVVRADMNGDGIVKGEARNESVQTAVKTIAETIIEPLMLTKVRFPVLSSLYCSRLFAALPGQTFLEDSPWYEDPKYCEVNRGSVTCQKSLV